MKNYSLLGVPLPFRGFQRWRCPQLVKAYAKGFPELGIVKVLRPGFLKTLIQVHKRTRTIRLANGAVDA